MTEIDRDWLAARFEQSRGRLRGVAYRMLGSLSEAEDAVQEAWLKLSHAGAETVTNLDGWLTTVVARVCLDALRARRSRAEEPLEAEQPGERPESAAARSHSADPEQEAVLADSVGLALLVVLDALAPAERIAFVLHDLFAMPFEEIAAVLNRNPAAARQLASRARRRVQGGVSPALDRNRRRQQEMVEAFLAASRAGDFAALVALLDPEIVLRTDAKVPGGAGEMQGAAAVARRVAAGRARAGRAALLDGDPGVVVAPLGQLQMVIRFTFAADRIVALEAIAKPERLRAMELGVLPG